MRKIILVILVLVLGITGCSKKEEKEEKVLDSFKCSLNVSNPNLGYSTTSEYIVYYEGDFVNNVEITETILSDDSDILDYLKSEINDMYKPLKEKYKGYSYKVTRDNGKIVSRVNVDYTKMDITMYLRDNPEQEQYFLGNKLTVEGIIDIYDSMEIGCEYNR